jgi:DNA modification methylase
MMNGFIDYGFKGMKVIDTHLGSGSSRISADRFGVSQFVGFEITEKHAKMSNDRVQNILRQPSLFVGS